MQILSAAPPSFSSDIILTVVARNPSVVPKAFSNVTLMVYHPTGIGRSSVPIGKAVGRSGEVKGYESTPITLRMLLQSRGNMYLAACAADLASNNACKLYFSGSLQLSVMGVPLSTVPIEFFAQLVRSTAAGDQGGLTLT